MCAQPCPCGYSRTLPWPSSFFIRSSSSSVRIHTTGISTGQTWPHTQDAGLLTHVGPRCAEAGGEGLAGAGPRPVGSGARASCRWVCSSPGLTRTAMRTAHGREQPAHGPCRPMTAGARVCAIHTEDGRHLGPATLPRLCPQERTRDLTRGRAATLGARLPAWLAKNLTAPALSTAHLKS